MSHIAGDFSSSQFKSHLANVYNQYHAYIGHISVTMLPLPIHKLCLYAKINFSLSGIIKWVMLESCAFFFDSIRILCIERSDGMSSCFSGQIDLDTLYIDVLSSEANGKKIF